VFGPARVAELRQLCPVLARGPAFVLVQATQQSRRP
jgi:hypothetical protein